MFLMTNIRINKRQLRDCLKRLKRRELSVFTKSNRQDARHIAYAVYNDMDIIASYNFRHIVRLSTIKKLQSANLILGYHTPEIRSPLELDL